MQVTVFSEPDFGHTNPIMTLFVWVIAERDEEKVALSLLEPGVL
jgi:hypothetical protein